MEQKTFALRYQQHIKYLVLGILLAGSILISSNIGLNALAFQLILTGHVINIILFTKLRDTALTVHNVVFGTMAIWGIYNYT